MEKTCKQCGEGYRVRDHELEFLQKISPSFDGEKFEIPVNEFCFECRQKQRLIWRNERVLHRRKCAATGKNLLSVFSQDSGMILYDVEYWYGDEWNALDYGRDFDFGRPFFEQFAELMRDVPQMARSVTANQNCDYVNQCGWSRNCYLTFEADHNENCLYANNLYDSRTSVDLSNCTNCELCYETIDCADCYNLNFSQDCNNCSDSWFLRNCIGCKNCFGCINLRNKEYYFLNQKCSKEEFERKVAEVNLGSSEVLQSYRQKFEEFCKAYPHKYMLGVQNDDSTGNYLYNTQRCENCFDLNESQDCGNVYNARNMKWCYDITVFGSHRGAEFAYFTHETGDSVRNILFSDQIWTNANDIYYSKLCGLGASNLFGCVGVRKKSYCVFNKQYSKEEYEKLVAKIIKHMIETGEWGEFFPKEISPFAYNETVLNEYYPMSKDEALEAGYRWLDFDFQTDVESVDVSSCKECGKSFKVVELEKKFYERKGLPLPVNCSDCRHRARFLMRNPRKLYRRGCDNCEVDFWSTYDSDCGRQIYCEKCYLDNLD